MDTEMHKHMCTQTLDSVHPNINKVSKTNSENKGADKDHREGECKKMILTHGKSSLRRNVYCVQEIENEKILEPLLDQEDSTMLEDVVNVDRCKLSRINCSIKSKCQSFLRYQKQNSNSSCKVTREKSSLILIGIVMVFLICNIPRVFVKIYIIVSGGDGKDHFEHCLKNGRLPVPAFIMIMGK